MSSTCGHRQLSPVKKTVEQACEVVRLQQDCDLNNLSLFRAFCFNIRLCDSDRKTLKTFKQEVLPNVMDYHEADKECYVG